MTFYTDAQDTAVALLTEFGATMTLVRAATKTFDPATSTYTETATTESILAARLEYGTRERGELIQMGDSRFIVSAKGMTGKPKAGEEITDPDGQTWRIVDVVETNPSGTPVIYECQCRQSS